MYLPGTINERIGDLRTSRGLSQKELCDMIGVVPSQLSRIEQGKIQNISNDILIKLSKALNVSTDYILGLTTLSVQKSYDISELGLSEGAVKALVTGSIDVQTLNKLLEHKRFPYLMQMIKSYFDGSIAAGVATRNELIDFVTATLGDFAKENPEHKDEILPDVRLLKSQKLGEHDAEIEKIKSTFLAILKDIKKGVGAEKLVGDVATAEFMRGVMDQLKGKPRSEISAEDVSAAVMNMVGQTTKLDDKSAKLFRNLMLQMLKQGSQD